MTPGIYWQLDVADEPRRGEPTARSRIGGVARDVRTASQNRFDYYAQIGRAAAQTGFDGLFLPHREAADDSQIVAAAIAREVPRLRLIPQFPASVGSAVYAAKQAVSFQRATRDRLAWAIAPDAAAAERARGADHVPEAELARRVEEFLTVARGVHAQRPFSFAGRHAEVQGGGFEAPLSRAAFPSVFLSGTTAEALDLSARFADVHLFGDVPPASLRASIEALAAAAAAQDRELAFGLVQPLVARESAEEAQQEARRSAAPRHALVGDYGSVARELGARVALGIGHLVLTASPSLEEAYRIGQHVLPRLRALPGDARAAA